MSDINQAVTEIVQDEIEKGTAQYWQDEYNAVVAVNATFQQLNLRYQEKNDELMERISYMRDLAQSLEKEANQRIVAAIEMMTCTGSHAERSVAILDAIGALTRTMKMIAYERERIAYKSHGAPHAGRENDNIPF